MDTTTMNRASPVVVLIATGFDELEVAGCLHPLREAGLRVALVGLTSGIIFGQHGLRVLPDVTLGQFHAAQWPPRLLVIPGGSGHAAALVADPRVHQLLQATLARQGQVAVWATAHKRFEPLLGEVAHPIVLCQNNTVGAALVAELVGGLRQEGMRGL